jgi:hypothetical protein
MRLEPLICELLYEHDCVVLPEFGGLVSNYRSARLNRRTHVIQPPSKHIGFNRHLKDNDGILVHQVSKILNITYQEASEKIKEHIAGYQQTLQQSGRLVLERIGVFFKDTNGQLQFIPDEQENFLTSSYGLRPVQLRFVEQEKTTVETPIIPIQDERREKMAAWKIAAAIAIPLMLAGSFFAGNQINKSGDFTLASLNPFHKVRINSDYETKVYFFSPEYGSDKNVLIHALDTATDNIHFDFIQNKITTGGVEIAHIKNEIAQPSTTEVKKENNTVSNLTKEQHSENQFAIIGGAFSVQENAENFLQKLRSEGYDAHLAGKKDGLQLVAYGSYPTRAEATTVLKKIKSSGSSAWIRRESK